MKYNIIADSSCDLNRDLNERLNIDLVPLKITIDGKTYVDDESLDKEELLLKMKDTHKRIQTACPSPGDFIKEYEKGENVFAVTLSSQLSATYNNAILAKTMVQEEQDKFIHVFDSLSASIGETLICMKINELIEKRYENENIINEVETYIKKMKTFFILESLDNLAKAGRINRLKADIASILSISPIMGSDGEGNIKLVEKVRGTKKAFNRLVEVIGEQGETFEDKVLGIAHCNALNRAEELKKKVEQRYNFKDIIIVETGGLSSVYATEGGIIIAF